MNDQPINSKAQLQEMLDSGKITEEEYAELLDALESSESPIQAKLTSDPVPPPVPAPVADVPKAKHSIILEIFIVVFYIACWAVIAVILPAFEDMFRDLGAPPPFLTRIFIRLSNVGRHYGFFLIPLGFIVFLLPAVLRRFVKDPSTKRLLLMLSIFIILLFLLTIAGTVLSLYLPYRELNHTIN